MAEKKLLGFIPKKVERLLVQTLLFVYISLYLSVMLFFIGLNVLGDASSLMVQLLLLWSIVSFIMVIIGSISKDKRISTLAVVSYVGLVAVTIPAYGIVNILHTIILVIVLVVPLLFLMDMILTSKHRTEEVEVPTRPRSKMQLLISLGASLIVLVVTFVVFFGITRFSALSTYIGGDSAVDIQVLTFTASLLLACTPFLLLDMPWGRSKKT